MDQSLFQQLERAVYLYTIQDVIRMLADVCNTKANQALTDWQDDNIAAKWRVIADDLKAINARIL